MNTNLLRDAHGRELLSVTEICRLSGVSHTGVQRYANLGWIDRLQISTKGRGMYLYYADNVEKLKALKAEGKRGQAAGLKKGREDRIQRIRSTPKRHLTKPEVRILLHSLSNIMHKLKSLLDEETPSAVPCAAQSADVSGQ